MSEKAILMSSVKSSGTAYLLWFFLGCHYAYLGKWLVQIIFWCTLGGFGLWAFIDLFRIGGMVSKHNAKIYGRIEDIDDLKHQRNLETLSALNQPKTVV